MDDDLFGGLLIQENDLDDSLFGEEPSAAFGPQFISGDEPGKFLIDTLNALTTGSHPETALNASAMFTNIVGSVVFHHVTRFGRHARAAVLDDVETAVEACSSYRMALNDGMELDVVKTGQELVRLGDRSLVVHWLSTVEHYRVENTWLLTSFGDIFSYINVRLPDVSEIHRLGQLTVDRVASLRGLAARSHPHT